MKDTTWFRISVWGKLAEVCNQYLWKGYKVFMTGRLVADPARGDPRIWNGTDGSAHTSFEVNAQEVRFLSSSSGEIGEVEGEAVAEGATSSEPEIPF